MHTQRYDKMANTVNQAIRREVKQVTKRARDKSLANGSKRERAQFARLTKDDKRAWRDAIQRNIARIKSSAVRRAFLPGRRSIKHKQQVQRTSKLEEALIDSIVASEVATFGYEAGPIGKVAAVVGAVSAAFAAKAVVKVGDTICNSAKKVDTHASEVKGMFAPIASAVNDFIQSVKKWGGFISKIAIAGLLFWILAHFGKFPIVAAGILAIATTHIPDTVQHLRTVIPGFKFESGGTFGVPATLMAIICSVWMPGVPSGRVAGEFMKRVAFFPRVTEGLEAFVKAFLDCASGFLNFVLRRTENPISFTGQSNAFTEWRVKVVRALKYLAEHQTLTPSELKELKKLQLTGYGFHEVLMSVEAKKELNHWMDKLNLALQPHEGALATESSFRPTPYCIMVGGPSAVGKTTLMRYVGCITLLLAGEVTAADCLENLWQKGTTEYWNGYTGQKCLILDDAFQVKGQPGEMDSEAMQLIRAIGNWSYPLNFADLASKGKIQMDSPLVIGTTNSKNVYMDWANVITCPEALVRRFQAAVWVTVNPTYATEDGRFDYDKVSMEIREGIKRGTAKMIEAKAKGVKMTVAEVLDELPWNVWDVHPHDFKSDNTTDQTVPGGLRGIIETAALTMKQRKEANREEISDLNELLRNMEDASLPGGTLIHTDGGSSAPSYKELCESLILESGGSETPEIQPISEVTTASHDARVSAHSVDVPEDSADGTPSLVEILAQPYHKPTHKLMKQFDKDFPPNKVFVWEKPGEGRTFFKNRRKSQFGHGDPPRVSLSEVSADSQLAGNLATISLNGGFVSKDLSGWRLQKAEPVVDHENELPDVEYDCPEELKHSISEAEFVGFLEAQKHEGIIFKAFRRLAKWYHSWVEVVAKTHPLVAYTLESLTILSGAVAAYTIVKVVIGVLSALVGVVGAILKQVAGIFGIKPKVSADLQMESNDTSNPPRPPKHLNLASANVEFQGAVASTPADKKGSDFVKEHVYAGTLKCMLGEVPLGQFIGLGADVFIFPKHFLSLIRKEDPLTVISFVSAKDDVSSSMTVREFLALDFFEKAGFDIAGVAFGMSFMKATKNILHYFLKEHEVKNVLRGSNYAVELHVALRNPGRLTLRQQVLYSNSVAYQGTLREEATGHLLNGLVRYTMPTEKGFCGAPLMISENTHFGGRAILGFHSGGRQEPHHRVGYASVVTQEFARHIFTTLATYVDKGVDDLESVAVIPSGQARITLESKLNESGLVRGSFSLLGELKEPVHNPTTSALKPTKVLHDEVFGPCPVEPAPLRGVHVDGVYVEPMVKALEAYQSPLLYKDPKMLEGVATMAFSKHWEATRNHPRCILTFEEAVVPPEGWKLKGINRRTSAGYKYREWVTPKLPGKTAFFGFNDDWFHEGQPLKVLRADVEKLIYDANESVRNLHLFTDFLKDELRPKEKAAAGMSRGISGAPLDYVVAWRMYFGAFMAATFDTHVDNGMAPGLNHYVGWYRLSEYLSSNGRTKFFDGDFKRYDASEQPWVHEAILMYVNRWYRFNNSGWREQDDVVRRTLYLDLVHSRHICGVGSRGAYVVQWCKSLPSGHPFTTIANSLYSLLTLATCYVRSTGQFDLWEHAALQTFGDDNVNSVDDTVSEQFNQVTVANMMQELFGMTYTPGSKAGVLVPHTSLDKVTFLKRSFAFDDIAANPLLDSHLNMGVVGPLAKESWLYLPYWYKSKRAPTEDLLERIKMMLCELSLHPAELWDEVYGKISTWCAEHDISMPFTSREATRTHVTTRFDVWF